MLSIGTPSLDRATDDDGQPKKKRGRSEENEANVINIDDDSGPMDLMFQLLRGTDRSHFNLTCWEVSELKDIKVVADKYDMPTVPRLLAECLWVGVSSNEGYYRLGAFAVAVHFGHKHLARYACSQIVDYEPPSQFSWETAQELGFEAYFILVTGESKCKPFSWKELSKRIFVSDHVQILESLSVKSLYTALHSA